MITMQKIRCSNYELLRIVAMAMIVLSHCVYFGVMNIGEPDQCKAWNEGCELFKIISATSILGATGVGLFFMISGYFTAHKKESSIKKVCTITAFYACLIFAFAIFIYSGGIFVWDKGKLILQLTSLLIIPITGSVWWFVTAYIYMMLIAPSYNVFLERFNRKGMFFWILFLLVFGQVLGNLGSNFHDIEKAVFFYTLGVYFRDYIKPCADKKMFFIVFFIGVVINGFCQYGIATYIINESSDALLLRKFYSMIDYLLAEPLSCVGLFGWFSCFKFYNGKINWIAKRTFGIYLLHEAPMMRLLIWMHIFKPYEYIKYEFFVYLYIVFCVMSIFVMGIIVDAMRERLLEKMYNRIIESIVKKIKETLMKEIT